MKSDCTHDMVHSNPVKRMSLPCPCSAHFLDIHSYCFNNSLFKKLFDSCSVDLNPSPHAVSISFFKDVYFLFHFSLSCALLLGMLRKKKLLDPNARNQRKITS